MAITNKTTNKLNALDVSIQLGLSGLSFCILQDGSTVTVLKQISFGKTLTPFEALDYLKNVFNTEPALNNSFSNITVIHDNDLSTLVPKPLFQEDYMADYLKFNTKILASDFLAHDHVISNDSVNVYVPYVNINNFIYDTFGAFTFKHVSTILIETILQIEKNSKTPKVYVNVSDKHFEIVVVNNGKLLLYNTFAYVTKEDFIYYILFTTEQLGLNPERFELIFIGNIDSKDELYTITYKYVQFVFFGKRTDTFKYKLDAQPKTDYSNFAILNSF
ncbi:MAG: DUF3822 family protein [Flavobacteriaceae bacterium]